MLAPALVAMKLLPSTPVEWLPALSSDTWFAQCPSDFQQALLSRAQLWSLDDGEALYQRGGRVSDLCCVTAGALRVGAWGEDGSASLLAYLEPYQWLGEISLLDERPRSHDVVADGPTTVLRVPEAALQAWLVEHPVHWRNLAQLACAKLRMVFMALEDIARLPLEQRLAKRLWLVAHGYGARSGPPRRLVRLPQEQLALMLGVSRQSASKALHALELQGWIRLRYGTIELLDLEALLRTSEVERGGAGPAGGLQP